MELSIAVAISVLLVAGLLAGFGLVGRGQAFVRTVAEHRGRRTGRT